MKIVSNLIKNSHPGGIIQNATKYVAGNTPIFTDPNTYWCSPAGGAGSNAARAIRAAYTVERAGTIRARVTFNIGDSNDLGNVYFIKNLPYINAVPGDANYGNSDDGYVQSTFSGNRSPTFSGGGYNGNGAWTPTYDFNVEVGDTIHMICYSSHGGITITVVNFQICVGNP